MANKNFRMPECQEEMLENLLRQTGLTFSEYARRLFDYGFQERVLNETIPSMSGQLQVNRVA